MQSGSAPLLAIIGMLITSCAPPYHRTMLADIDDAGTRLAAKRDQRSPAVPSGTRVDYIAFALREQPELLAAHQRWRAAALNVDSVGTWPEPVISYGYFLRSVETRVGPQRHRFGVMQPLPWPTKLTAPKKVARANAKGEQAKFEAAMLMTRMRVSEIFWRVWLVARVREWREQQVGLLEALSASLRARIETGRAQLSDLNQVELRLSRVRDMLLGLEEKEHQMKAALLAVVGAAQSSDVPIASTPPVVPQSEPDEEALVAGALQHPRVQIAEAMREMNEQKARREALRAFPDFSLGVDYIETGPSVMTPAPMDSGKDPIIAMMSIKVPLWFGDYASGRDSARAEAAAAAAAADAIRDELRAAIRSELSRLRDARRRLGLYEGVLIPQAEAAYASVIAGYESGNVEVAAALLAQRELVELHEGIAEALAEIGQSMAVLEQLTAEPLQ